MPFTFNLEIDKEALAEVVDYVNTRIDLGMDDLVEEVEWNWRRIAASSSELKSTKSKYLDAIEVKREGDEVVLTLNDELISGMEAGTEPYDLKPGFLKGHTHRVIPLVDKGTNNVTRFRTVTASSPGWIHPGFKPLKIVEQVKEEMGSIVTEVFSRVLI